jgi:hypothetical protein
MKSKMSPEKKLWQSVVYLAVLDATNPNPTRTECILDQRDAHNWITKAGRDFRFACENAGLCPDFIAKSYTEGRINRDMLKTSNLHAIA